MRDTLLALTDSYKLSHYRQYPPGTTNVFSYFESRVGARFDETCFFGLQYLLKRYLVGEVVSRADVEAMARFTAQHVGPGVFHADGWNHIVDAHGGRLPVRIRAVPEGTAVPTGNVLMTIEATDPRCYWLPNYLETLLVQVWYPATVCTLSRASRRAILRELELTGDPAGIDFKLHDFGFRGVSSVESAKLGGLAHLVSFDGTDTIAGVLCGMQYYRAEVCGFSIPASEHSTITSWGEAFELDAYRNMLESYPTGLVACVSDSYDIEHAVSELWGEQLRAEVQARDGTLVVRPDSGEPTAIVPDVLERLAAKFGAERNAKGYLVLNPKVRVIQGDGCSYDSIQAILRVTRERGFSADNLTFGMGGGLLQKVDRDTQSFAFKCSAVTVDGVEREVYKRPASDPAKNSKRGRLALVRTDDGFETVRGPDSRDVLRTVFENGELTIDDDLAAIRKRAR